METNSTELPHLNVFTKLDMIDRMLPEKDNLLNADFYLEQLDLKQTIDRHSKNSSLNKLSENLCELIDAYALVGFASLDVQVSTARLSVLCDHNFIFTELSSYP